MYRVGLPGWKLVARFGLPVRIRVQVHYDPEVKSYWTTSPDLKGLVVTGESIDDLVRETKIAMHDLMDIELRGANIHATPTLSFTTDAMSAA